MCVKPVIGTSLMLRLIRKTRCVLLPRPSPSQFLRYLSNRHRPFFFLLARDTCSVNRSTSSVSVTVCTVQLRQVLGLSHSGDSIYYNE